MASLSDEQKMFLIDRLACFSGLDEIVNAFQDVYGVSVPKPTILRYDPTTVQGSRELAEKWKELFAARRRGFLEDVSAIPIANKAVRLRRLDDLSRSPLVLKNPVQLRATLEQAAKEVNNFWAARPTSAEAGAESGGPTPDADAEAAERSTRVDALVDAARARRDRDHPPQGAEGHGSAPAASG